MSLQRFFIRHPVFTIDEAQQFINQAGTRSKNTLKALLRYYVNKGVITHIKRGLYAAAPVGVNEAKNFPIDPYLISAKLTKDAVISHHTALAFYGHTYTVANRFIYSTRYETPKFDFQNCQYQGVLFPKKLRDAQKEEILIKPAERLGMTFSITSFERTLVDLLDRPDLGFGWEEIWRSLENVGYFDIPKVLEYTLLLNNTTTTAKVGFYLEQHRDALMVEENDLQILEQHKPKQSHYMDKNYRQPSKLQKRWNLIVPNIILEKTWEEPL